MTCVRNDYLLEALIAPRSPFKAIRFFIGTILLFFLVKTMISLESVRFGWVYLDIGGGDPCLGLYTLLVLANKHKMKFPGGHLGNTDLELNKEGKGEEEEDEEESGRQETGKEEGKEIRQ